MGRMWEDWWRTHAGAGTEPWQPEPARTGEWTEVPEPMRNWKTWGVPLLARHDGMVWFRRTVTLTPAQASRAATLSLGAIDEVDQTWVNGRAIRNTFGWGTDRTYALPAGVLRAGENVIVVNVLSTWDAGGMTGPAEKLALAFDDGTKVALGGGWRYQVVPLEIGRPPRAPWESVAGLTTLYNGMIAPLGPFGLRGAVWYQGETNADAPAGYQAILAGLMSSWRAQFGAELPFVVVQLPGLRPGAHRAGRVGVVRRSRRAAPGGRRRSARRAGGDDRPRRDATTSTRSTSVTSGSASPARRATSPTASRSRRPAPP